MEQSKDFLGRGFSFPPRIDAATGKFIMVENEEDIRQAVLIILETRTMERAMLPEFGCDIYKYMFELPDATFEHLICDEIEQILTDHEPRIRDVQASIDASDRRNGQIRIHLRYVVRATNNPGNMVYPYYLDGR